MSPANNPGAADDLGGLRRQVTDAVAASVAAQARFAAAQARLDQAIATGTGDVSATRAELIAATNAAEAARGTASSAGLALDGALSGAIGTVIGAVGGVAGPPVVAPAAVPVALLPVGIETRFSGDTLLVRVIPDEIHVEDHEPELTDSEVDAGRSFWRAVWRGGTAEPAATAAERDAWARLLQAIGTSRRATWVADQTQPDGTGRPAAAIPADQPLPEPPFPDPPRRAGVWSRAAHARTLPDRFVAIAYRKNGSGGTVTWTEIARAEGRPIGDRIQLGLDPTAPPPTVTDDGPTLPDGMQWMVNVEAADEAGLLVRVTLPPGTVAVDRLVVLGVLQTLDPAASADRLDTLLRGHHHTRGLEVLRTGTPTNNTAGDQSGYGRVDDSVRSFDVERRTPPAPDGSDGGLLARALGIGADVWRGVANSGDAEQAVAGQMNALVWPVSFGYWFDSLVQPGPDDGLIADIRRHAVQTVRGRGPLPSLRVGTQPYGVLPVTSLRRWQPGGEAPGVVHAARFMQTVLSWWLDGVDRAPIVRAGRDPDQGVLDALGQAAVSTTCAVRSMVGANACFIPFATDLDPGSGSSLGGEANRQRWLALTGFRALGVVGFPYLGQLIARPDPVPLLSLPYTVDARLTPDQQATAWQAITTYLAALRGRTTASLRGEDPRTLTSMLTLLARRSVMLERVRAGIKDTNGKVAGLLVEAHVRIDEPTVIDAALIATTATLRIGETRAVTTVVLDSSVAGPGGGALAMNDHLDAQLVTGVLDVDRYLDYSDTVHAAEAVATLAPDRAALLLGEAIDVASHRYDAWITSLATRRLSDLRAATPMGITIGAYGAVEELTRRPPRPPVTTPPAGAPTPLNADVDGGGYIHAPSMAQAATAAVLRAGHLSHTASDPHSASLAIDLSSSRVRTALALLDGVREGQSLGALLGYNAERQLHDLGAHNAVEVVRDLAPPPVVTAPGTPEGIPPRAVCDGLALSRLDRQTVLDAVTARGAEATAVGTVLVALGDAVDAVADLLLAEGVHQIVRGNPERAAAALDTLNRGEGAVAAPAVVDTPRTGTGLTQRVLIAIGHEAPAAPGWPTDGVRATVEPRVAAWAGHLLGDPGALAFTVTSPTTGDGQAPHLVIPLSNLRLGALDVVYEDLTARILRHARGLGAAEDATVDLDAPSVAPLLTMARLLRDLLSQARPGSGLDLARAQDRGTVTAGPPPLVGDAPPPTMAPDVDHGARAGQLAAAAVTLQGAIDALPELTPGQPVPAEASIAAALDTFASFGLAPGGVPSRPPDTAALIALRSAAIARHTAAIAPAAANDPTVLFGDGFPVLPLVAALFPAAVAAALDVDPVAAAPEAVLAPFGGAAHAVESWLEAHGRVRPPVGRFADVLLAARLRATAGPARLSVVQLPAEPFPDAPAAQRGQWIGLPFPAPLGPEPVTAFVVHALGTLHPAAGVALLVVDDFTEVVPSADTTTAISFGFDAPGARPPQSILLAVPPVPGASWTVDDLAGVIGETLDLAKIRMVDLSSVAWAGRFVPTIHLTDGDISGGLDLPIRDIIKLADATFKAVTL